MSISVTLVAILVVVIGVLLLAIKILQDTIQKGIQDTRTHVKESLTHYAQDLGKRFENLTHTTDLRLKEMNAQIEKRLTIGFEKTTETFGDIIKRLTMIDAAQKKMAELASSIVSLQETLNDKPSSDLHTSARFQEKMDHLARHIEQVNTDILQIHISAKKITERFEQMEQVDAEKLAEEVATV